MNRKIFERGKLIMLFIIFFINTGFPKEKSTNNKSHLEIKFGYPFIFGYIGDKTVVSIPYIGVSYKTNMYKSEIVFWEHELGYFGYTTDTNKYVETNKANAIPITFSVVWETEIGSNFYLFLQIGFGSIILYTKSGFSNKKSGFSGLMTLKSALFFTYRVSDNWYISLGGSLYMAQDVKEYAIGKNLNYYFISSFIASYSFYGNT